MASSGGSLILTDSTLEDGRFWWWPILEVVFVWSWMGCMGVATGTWYLRLRMGYSVVVVLVGDPVFWRGKKRSRTEESILAAGVAAIAAAAAGEDDIVMVVLDKERGTTVGSNRAP